MAESSAPLSGFGIQSSDSITLSGSVNAVVPLTMGSTVPLETSIKNIENA